MIIANARLARSYKMLVPKKHRLHKKSWMFNEILSFCEISIGLDLVEPVGLLGLQKSSNGPVKSIQLAHAVRSCSTQIVSFEDHLGFTDTSVSYYLPLLPPPSLLIILNPQSSYAESSSIRFSGGFCYVLSFNWGF